jgi:hypothetical protein
MKEFSITYIVSSESSETLRLLRRQLADDVRPDNVLVDVAQAKDRVSIHHHRLGDYFSSVRIADNSPTSFRLVFAPYPDADRYWKDLVVRIVTSIRGEGVLVQTDKSR